MDSRKPSSRPGSVRKEVRQSFAIDRPRADPGAWRGIHPERTGGKTAR